MRTQYNDIYVWWWHDETHAFVCSPKHFPRQQINVFKHTENSKVYLTISASSTSAYPANQNYPKNLYTEYMQTLCLVIIALELVRLCWLMSDLNQTPRKYAQSSGQSGPPQPQARAVLAIFSHMDPWYSNHSCWADVIGQSLNASYTSDGLHPILSRNA